MKNNNFFNDIAFQALPNNKLIELFNSISSFERGRALTELARRSGQQEEIIELVVREIKDPNNRNARTVGLVSVSHLGIAGLLEADTPVTINTVKKLLKEWPEPDRSDLICFLDSAYSVHGLQ